MPTQALLKATLLKETYVPVVELSGPSQSNHAVASIFRSRLSGMERQFLDLIAPQLFSISGVQEYRRSSRHERPGLQFQDFVDVYERLLAASSWTKRHAKVVHVDEDFEFSTTQLHRKVSTPQRHLRNILSSELNRAAEKPVSAPEETLKKCRIAILETVFADLHDEEGSWPVSTWDAKEDPSGIQMPFGNLKIRQRQVGMQREKSGLSSGTVTRTVSSSPPMSATIGGDKIGNQAEKKMVDTVSTLVIQHTVEENGRGEKTFAKHLQQALEGVTEETAEEKPVSENSNARLSYSRSMSHDRSCMSFMELLVDGENLEDRRRGNSSRGDFNQGRVFQRWKSSDVDEVDLTLPTTKGGVKSVLSTRSNSMRTSREVDHLFAQILDNKRSQSFDQRVNNTVERCRLARPVPDAKPVRNSRETPEVSENPSAKSYGNINRRVSSLERLSNVFGKSRSMKESRRFTDAKQDSSRGCPEVSHISNIRQVALGKSRSLRDSLGDRAVFRMDSSKSGTFEVSGGNQINGSAANSHRVQSFWERSSERFRTIRRSLSTRERSSERFRTIRRSLSARERDYPAAVHNYINSCSSTTTTAISNGSTRSWAPALPTIARKTVEKLQGILGRSTSLRATHAQPIVERDQARSTHESQERNAPNNLPHGKKNDSSWRQVPMDGNNIVRARCGTRSAESSFREEGQTISSLLAEELKQESKFVNKTDPSRKIPLLNPLARRLKSILGRGHCKVSDATDPKVVKAPLWSAWSVSYTDGLSPPKEGVCLKNVLGESPRSSSTRRVISPKRMHNRGYSVSPKRMSPRGYPVSPRRVSLRKHPMSPARNGGFGSTKHKRSVKSDGFNKRRLPNRSDPTPSKIHPIGWTAELPSSGVPRPAETTLQMELTDMGCSGALNLKLTEQCREAGRQSEGSKVWPRPLPDYYRRRPTSRSRFQREHIAIHNISAIACEN